MKMNILKHFGLAALLALGANAGAETYAVATQAQLDEANAKATRGDTIQITAPCVDGEYVLNSVGVGYAVRATVPGVCLKRIDYSTDRDDYIGGPVSLSNLTWRVAKGYYPHFKGVSAVDCTFKGFFNAEDGCTFDNCTFYAPGTDESGIADVDYYMWCYSGDVTFRSCHFHGAGKHLHCYNEGNNPTDATTGKKIPWTVTLDGCDFHSTKSDKPAVNVKELCGSTPLYYNVIISNCTTDGNFPTAGAFDAAASKYVISPLVQVDVRNRTSASEGISIALDGKSVYKDGAVPQSAAVAKIGETEYASINEAFDAVNSQVGDKVTIKILCDVNEELTKDYEWTKDVLITTDNQDGVTVDLGFRYERDLWCLLDDAHMMTIDDGVTILGLGQLLAGWGDVESVVDVDGDVTAQQLWAFCGTANVNPTATVVLGYGDGMMKISDGGVVNVAGKLEEGAAATLDYATAVPQVNAGYVQSYHYYWDCYNRLNLTDTFMKTTCIVSPRNDSLLVSLDNSVLYLNETTPPMVGWTTEANSKLDLVNGSRIICEATMTFDGEMSIEIGSQIKAKGFVNKGSLDVYAEGLAEPVKVIDYEGTGKMTLEDYGEVAVWDGKSWSGAVVYVEDNDLWVKSKAEAEPETKVVVPDASEIKPVDEEGKEITGDDAEKAKEAAKEAVEDLAGNTGATMTGGTGVEAAVFASDEEVKADVAQGLQTAAAVVTQDDKGVDLTKDEQDEVKAKVAEVATSKDVSSYVKIDVKSPVVKVEAAVATVKSLVFDVQPMAVSKITTTVDETNPKTVTVEAPVNYNDSAKPITFRLPLTDAFTVSAIVTHEGDPDRLCQVQGPAGSRYVEVSATHFSLFSVAPSDIVETSASSKTILGIKRIDYTVTQKTADLAAAVPWLKAAGEDMPVAKLITTGLSAGDMIQVYDLEKKTYFSWHYDGTAWASDALSTGGSSPSAETYPLKRGAAFWYKPAGAVSGTYTQVGLYSDLSAVTTKVSNVHADGVTQASFANPVHNLLASPKYEDFSVPVGLTAEKGCAKDDVVVVVATGARYRFDGTTWGQDVDREVTKFGVTVTQKAFAPIGAAGVGDGVVPAGTAFWYLSAGGAPEFAW